MALLNLSGLGGGNLLTQSTPFSQRVRNRPAETDRPLVGGWPSGRRGLHLSTSEEAETEESEREREKDGTCVQQYGYMPDAHALIPLQQK